MVGPSSSSGVLQAGSGPGPEVAPPQHKAKKQSFAELRGINAMNVDGVRTARSPTQALRATSALNLEGPDWLNFPRKKRN
eukprot:12399834-Karenia_brevis.AAC.1